MMETDLTKIPGIGASTAELLKQNGYRSVEAVANADIEGLSKVRGFSIGRAEKVIQQANVILAGESSSAQGVNKNAVVEAVSETAGERNAISENNPLMGKAKEKNKRKDKKKDKKQGTKNKKKDKKKGKKEGKKKKSKDKSKK